MLTKEECVKALDILTKHECCYCDFEDDECLWQCALEEMLNQLIEEHFYNPPLKFEELKEGMWLWDNKRKEWCKFLCCCVFEYLNGYDNKFEENRFYRREVE